MAAVQVIDLAQGEHIPQEIIDALTDDEVTNGLSMQTLNESACPGIFPILA
jgi:hypothetical protein